jgi:hypothetical protein
MQWLFIVPACFALIGGYAFAALTAAGAAFVVRRRKGARS